MSHKMKNNDDEHFKKPSIKRRGKYIPAAEMNQIEPVVEKGKPDICVHLKSIDSYAILKCLNYQMLSCVTCMAPAVFICAERKCANSGKNCFCSENDHIKPHFRHYGHRLLIHIPKQIIACSSCRKTIHAGELLDMRGKTLIKHDGVYSFDKTIFPIGSTGLLNTGNTCYANAALQLLSHCSPFASYFRDYTCTSDVKIESQFFTECFARLVKILYSENRYSSIDPSDILDIIRGKTMNFHQYQQHDSQEFMKAIIDTISEELQQSTSAGAQSAVTDLFNGQMESVITCSECHNVSGVSEQFTDLSLSLIYTGSMDYDSKDMNGNETSKDGGKLGSVLVTATREVDIADCLEDFFQTTDLDGDNQYRCDRCEKHVDAVKTLKLSQLPNVLCVHLKRFKHDQIGSSKIGSPIIFPSQGLDLSNYSSVGDVSYNLTGFITHEGSGSDCGHYMAYCYDPETMQWFEFDDSNVRRVDDIEAAKKRAYVLLFIKKEYEEAYKNNWLSKKSKLDDFLEPKCYVPKNWWLAVRRGEFQKINNRSILCEHGFLDAIIKNVEDDVVEVSQSFFEHIHEVVGGDPMIKSLDRCVKCHAALMNEEIKRFRAGSELNKNDDWIELCRNNFSKGLFETHLPDTIINVNWLTKLNEYLLDPRTPLPGKISNKFMERYMEDKDGQKRIVKSIPGIKLTAPEVYSTLSTTFGSEKDVYYTNDVQPDENALSNAKEKVAATLKDSFGAFENLIESNEKLSEKPKNKK